METKKEVLVALGERKRPVTFQSSCDPSKEKELLLMAIRNVFSDILKRKEEDHMVLLVRTRVRSERWNGELVELHGDMFVDNNSIVHLSVDAESSVQEVSMIAR